MTRLKPRLLHVFNTFNPGGAQTRFAALANHFGSSIEHIVVAMDGSYGCADRLDSSLHIEFHQVPVLRNSFFGNLRTFRNALIALNPDRLVTHNWGTVEWAMARTGLSLAHVHIEDGFGPEEAENQFRRRILTRRVVLRSSTVVVPSLSLSVIASRDWHIKRSRLRYIPNGIDYERFAKPEPLSLTAPFSQQSDDFIIGTVAALREEKNIARLLRAFAIVNKKIPSRLVIVGDGAELQHLRILATNLKIENSVTFVGHASDPSIFYRDFDIFALTSDTEQMPYTVLEAMASSCAVVATDVGDIGQMVARENRPFIVPKSPQAVAVALIELLKNEELRRHLGELNKKRVLAQYDQRAMFAAFANLYQLPDHYV